jgi:peptidoglycan hydrolase-like protein with peptidoglycan-binding domain
MHISSGKVVAGLIIATAVMPFMASAQTTDTASQIQALLGQIKSLQQQLMTLVASSSASAQTWVASTTPSWLPGSEGGQKPPCLTLPRNLSVGSRGDDVKQLQQTLADDPESGFKGTVTGFFGPLTARAMANFQMHNGIASSTTGFVGALTRGFFDRKCGKGEGQGGMMEPSHVSGTITASSASSLTLQNGDGQSVVVNISASTSIQVFAGTTTPPTIGTASDLVVGKTAAADGPKNSDGSIQAVHVMVGILPPPPKNGSDQGEGLHGMMPTINGPQGGQGNGNGGPQNW